MNMGPVDDEDLLQNYSGEQILDHHDSYDEQEDYYAVNSEGDSDQYPTKSSKKHQGEEQMQPRGLRGSNYTRQNDRSLSGNNESNYLEQETFSLQQQDTFQNPHESDPTMASQGGQLFFASQSPHGGAPG